MAFDMMPVMFTVLTAAVGVMTFFAHKNRIAGIATTVLVLFAAAVVGISYDKRDNDKKSDDQKQCLADSIEKNHVILVTLIALVVVVINVPLAYIAME
jgi:Ca2+/Na+ antiporter